jgi:tricorn protease-like protein
MGDETDARSDLFSLGAIMYEMCAGQPPFTGNSALAILKQIADAKHRPIRELNPSIPTWLAETVDDLLAKKPADRIQTAAQLAELLEFEWALMKTTSEDVPTVCLIEQNKRRVRNRWIAVAVGATALTLGLIGGSYLASHRATGPAAAKSTSEPIAVLSANAGTVWAVAFNRTSDTIAMGVEEGSMRFWDLAGQSVKSTFDAHSGTIWSAHFSPNGEFLATAGDDNTVKLWKLPEYKPVRSFQHQSAVRSMTFTSDGKRIYSGERNGHLHIWSPDSDKPIAESQQTGTIYALALSPDDETLATGGSDRIVRLWNAKTLTQRQPLDGHKGPINSLSFSHDGKRLASAGWDRTIRIWDAGSGLLLKSWEGHAGDIWSVQYSPDGKQLASSGTDGAVKLWDAETGELKATYLGHKNAVHTLTFNSDGTLIATGGRDGTVSIWKLEK